MFLLLYKLIIISEYEITIFLSEKFKFKLNIFIHI